jgi:hypothetical protein
MTKLFDDLKAGLEDIDRFLGVEKAGLKVTLPAEADTVIARNPRAVIEALHPEQGQGLNRLK